MTFTRNAPYTTHDSRYHTAYIPTTYNGGPDVIELESRCVMCQMESRIEVTLNAYSMWNMGTAVQSAFPFLSPADREQFFMTGICGQCWDQMFLGQEDD